MIKNKLKYTALTLVGLSLVISGGVGINVKAMEVDVPTKITDPMNGSQTNGQRMGVRPVEERGNTQSDGYGQNARNVDLEKMKERFIKTVDRAIEYLNRVRNRYENGMVLGEANQKRTEQEIGADIAWLEAKKAEIQNADNASQLRELAKEVRQYWVRARNRSKVMLGEVAADRLENVFVKLENVGVKVKVVIDDLKAEGKDVTQAEALYANFEDKLAMAKDKYEAVKSELDSALTSDNPQVKSDYFQEVNQYIKDAYDALKEVIQLIKTM